MKSPIFKIGEVLNPLSITIDEASPIYKSVSLRYPYRLNAMALDPSKIAVSDDYTYQPGEIIFNIDLFREIQIVTRADSAIEIVTDSGRRQLIVHAVELMRSALDIKHGFSIKVKTEHEYKHTGFGSSSTLIAGVASAINELYGNPIDPNSLIKYLAQNHGEEIKNDDAHLQHVQCIGGGAAAGLIKAGSVILAGQSQCVAQMDIDDSYFVVIGVPRSYIPKDSAELMELELKNMDKFIETGKKYGASVAYQILHSVLPEMKNNQMKALGDVIYKYRFEYGSIDNCSFAYPPILDIAEKLKRRC